MGRRTRQQTRQRMLAELFLLPVPRFHSQERLCLLQDAAACVCAQCAVRCAIAFEAIVYAKAPFGTAVAEQAVSSVQHCRAALVCLSLSGAACTARKGGAECSLLLRRIKALADKSSACLVHLASIPRTERVFRKTHGPSTSLLRGGKDAVQKR